MRGLDTHTQDDYSNPRCACAPRVNNTHTTHIDTRTNPRMCYEPEVMATLHVITLMSLQITVCSLFSYQQNIVALFRVRERSGDG